MEEVQLFYSYISKTDTNHISYLQQSTSAIINNEAYTYSLVFDKNRNTIWAQNEEYGKTKIAIPNYNARVEEIRSGIPVKTYDGIISYFYINESGELTIYNSVKIESFDIYYGNNIVTNQQLSPQVVTGNNYLDKFIVRLSGTDAVNKSLSEVKFISNSQLTSQGNYPATSGTMYNVSTAQLDGDMIQLIYDNNSSVSHTGVSNTELTMTLRVKDRLGNIDEKTITVVKFIYPLYYGTAEDLTSSNISSIISSPSFQSQPLGDIGSSGNMKTILGSEYFWVVIPQDAYDDNTFSSCIMYQGGGEAEWEINYPITIGNYRVYRTPYNHIQGAEFYVKIN